MESIELGESIVVSKISETSFLVFKDELMKKLDEKLKLLTILMRNFNKTADLKELRKEVDTGVEEFKFTIPIWYQIYSDLNACEAMTNGLTYEQQFTMAYKNWVHDLVCSLQKLKREYKWFDAKQVLEPFLRLSFSDLKEE